MFALILLTTLHYVKGKENILIIIMGSSVLWLDGEIEFSLTPLIFLWVF